MHMELMPKKVNENSIYPQSHNNTRESMPTQ